MSSFKSFHITILLALGWTLALAAGSFAQTEFQGEVSGVWNRDGSPYIQVGAATVPQGQRLTILPGVEVTLLPDAQLRCLGLITALGTEEDTIRFRAPEGQFGGEIWFDTVQDTIRFAYCRFDSLQEGLGAWNSGTLFKIEHCFFYETSNPIVMRGQWGEVTHCVFYSLIYRGGIRMGRQYDDGVQMTFSDNQALSGQSLLMHSGQVIVERNRGRHAYSEDGRLRYPRAHFSDCGHILFNQNENLHFQSDNLNRVCWDIEITDNSSDYEGRGGGIVIVNPIRARPICSRNYFPHVSIIINWVTGFVAEDNVCSYFEVKNTCEATLDYNQGFVFFNGQGSVVTATNCLMYKAPNWPEHHATDAVIALYGQDMHGNRINLHNNIIFGQRDYQYAVGEGIEVSGTGYNLIWGTAENYAEREDLLPNDIVDTDPLLRGGFPFDVRLRADSPCIDAGDPDSPEDPDGTRADIGCFFFDQENGEPPALDRRWDYYVGWNETFRYAARAVDEGERLEIEFDGLPEWLEIEDEGLRDFVRDSVLVSGVVPEGQEDFVFNARVRDDADREDTLSVRVMVYPYRVLTGVVRGVLDIEQSPFIVADTAWVPTGDSLVIPPGTRLFFDNRNDSLAGRKRSILMVMGTLKAVGTEEDTITFTALDTSRSNSGLRFEDNDEGYSEFCFCKFDKTSFNYSSRRCNILVNNSLLNNSYVRASGFTIRTTAENNIGGSISISGKATIRENLRSGLSLWLPDSVEISNNELGSVWMWFGMPDIIDNGYITMHHNYITGEFHTNSYHDDGNDTIIVRNNHFDGGNKSVDLMGSNYIEFSNNLVTGGGETALSISPYDRPTRIFNNVFTNSRKGIRAYYQQEFPENIRHNLRIENNVFYSMDTLIHIHYQRNHISGVRYNSFYGFDTIGNDTTFDMRLLRVNSNGDSCDAHYNIYLDPRLANPDSLDFRLYADSPLINAGNPDSTFNDVDGSVNDIGLFGGPFGQSYEYPEGVGDSEIPPPEGFTLSAPWPNPFNSQTSVAFTLPEPGDALVKVYDVTGRLVFGKELTGLQAGSHQYVWKGEDDEGRSLSTGIYYFELTFQGAKLVRKMVMLK